MRGRGWSARRTQVERAAAAVAYSREEREKERKGEGGGGGGGGGEGGGGGGGGGGGREEEEGRGEATRKGPRERNIMMQRWRGGGTLELAGALAIGRHYSSKPLLRHGGVL